jgi:hypothetical protein
MHGGGLARNRVLRWRPIRPEYPSHSCLLAVGDGLPGLDATTAGAAIRTPVDEPRASSPANVSTARYRTTNSCTTTARGRATGTRHTCHARRTATVR